MSAKFYIDRARELVKEGNENPLRTRDESYAHDLWFMMGKLIGIIDQLATHKTITPDDDVLTIAKLQSITRQIGDPDLERYFTRQITEALQLPSVQEPLKISKEI